MRKKNILTLFLLALSALAIIGPRATHASPTPTNVLVDSDFEQGTAPCSQVPQQCAVGWDFALCEGVADATVALDASQWTNGANSAKVATGPITPTGCFSDNYTGRAVGFSQFRAKLIAGLGYNFTTLTDDPAGFSFWFQLQPYDVSTGIAGFEVRIFGAEGLSELDYVFNPDPSVGAFQNNTSTHSLLFYGYQYGQWYHFSRNLRADWLTPMGPADKPLNLNYNFTLVQFQGFAARTGSTIKSETFWIDDVRAYQGPGTIPVERNYTFFSFTDITGSNVDSVVKWTIQNATGGLVQYTLSSVTLPPGPYYLRAYYQTINPITLILTQEIHLNQSSLIPLSLYNSSAIVPEGIIALDNPVTSLQANSPDNTTSIISVAGPPGTPYNMIVKVPAKPFLLQANGQSLTQNIDWTYDGTLSMLRVGFIMAASGENISIIFQKPLVIPTLSFVDRTGSPVDSRVNFSILDSKGNHVLYNPGTALSKGTYYLEAYFEGFTVYRTDLSGINCSICTITLEMTPLDLSRTGYLALNSTATSLLPSEYSSTRVSFIVVGQGPYLIIVNVPKRPLYVEQNGVRTANWIYDNTTKTVTIQAASAGTFLVALEQAPPSDFFSIYLIVGISAAAVAGAIAAWYLFRSRRANPDVMMPSRPPPKTPR